MKLDNADSPTYDSMWLFYYNRRLENYIRLHWKMPLNKEKYGVEIEMPIWLRGTSQEIDKTCSVVKFLYTYYYYSMRECALVVGKSESYVRKILNGTRGNQYAPSLDKTDDNSLKRIETLDRLMSLDNYEDVPPNSRYQYISLLAYLGFDYGQMEHLFAGNKNCFIWRAMNRSNKAWKDFDTTSLDINQDDYKFLMKL